MRTAIVKKSDYTIEYVYDGSPTPTLFGGPEWRNASLYSHVEFDDNITGDQVKAQDNGGNIEIVKDIQANRDHKLSLLRAERNIKISDVDIMCNELALGIRADTAAVEAYREDLKNITDSYKDGEDPNKGTSALDSIADDLSDLVWPTKP